MSRIGVIITTYSGTPFVHLTLKFIKQLPKDIHILVHDDSSGDKELKHLCNEYGVDLISTSQRLGHVRGDISGILAGYQWGLGEKLDVVVKLSRRFIPRIDFTEEIEKLFLPSHYSTCSSKCLDLKLPFRSEAMAFKVADWQYARGMHLLQTFLMSGDITYVESLMHYLSAKVESRIKASNIKDQRMYEFYNWSFLGNSRVKYNENYLWHESNNLEDYKKFSDLLGIDYHLEDFGKANLF